jgi:hypothetical protein
MADNFITSYPYRKNDGGGFSLGWWTPKYFERKERLSWQQRRRTKAVDLSSVRLSN